MLARDPPCPRPSAASCKGVTEVKCGPGRQDDNEKENEIWVVDKASPHSLPPPRSCLHALVRFRNLRRVPQLGRRRMMQMGGVRVYGTGGREAAERSNGPAARSPVTG
jgi:hypothetical protein